MTRLGILGGGQLAQMMTQTAISLGVETAIFERHADSPAARLTHYQIVGQWDDPVKLDAFAEYCDVITLENEFVDTAVLRQLENKGIPVYPTSGTLAAVQDKLIQKQRMAAAGIPVPAFREIHTPDDITEAAAAYGYPLLLKARRDGYDGYGNVTLHSHDDIPAAWKQLGADTGRALLAEEFVPFVRELAVMVLRGRNGETRPYPVVETVQQNHICHVVRTPAPIRPATERQALEIAQAAVSAIEGVGVFGVEMFEMGDGSVLYNEIAPRPHNSGHYTIEACLTSQFENHIRAVLGWPLGSTQRVAPAAVMVNVLGGRDGHANPDAARQALAVPGAHVHIYGKRDVRPGRKMGHVTVIGDSIDKAETIARQAADQVDF